MLLDQLRVHDDRHHHREVGDGEAVLLEKVDAESAVVDHDELLRLGHRPRTHLEGREAADGDGAVERPLHVLGGDGRAVLEGGVLLELEGDRHVADVHVVGKLHLELVAVVVRHAVDRLRLMADEPVVAIPCHLVAGHVGADAVDIEVVGPALGNEQQRLLARLRFGGRPDGRRRRQCAAGRQRGHRLQEIAALHPNLQTGTRCWRGCPQRSCQNACGNVPCGNGLRRR